ncbi:MAG: hypothetical protein ABIK36_06295 [Pseudomonadota bacterium]
MSMAAQWNQISTTTGALDPRDNPRPKAHDIFLAWLLWLPDGLDRIEAARSEIDKIDRCGETDPTTRELRHLLDALIASAMLH